MSVHAWPGGRGAAFRCRPAAVRSAAVRSAAVRGAAVRGAAAMVAV